MPDMRNDGNEQEPPRTNGEETLRVEEPQRHFVWSIPDDTLEASIAGTTIAFSVILIVAWLIKASFIVDQSDIQTAVQISAAIGSLSLAVPLFLKDFKVQETLWKSFLIISIIFLISTCVGFVAFLLLQINQEVEVKLISVGLIIIVVSSRTFVASLKLWNSHKNKNQQRQDPTTNSIPVHIRPTKPSEFLIILALVLVCIPTCNGWSAAFLLLFSYGIMLLFATLIASIISIFTYSNERTSTEEAKHKLKVAIQEVLEKNKQKAFTEQELLDALREGPYKGHTELISRSVVQIALREMDIEYRVNAPKATEHKKFIPRWSDSYNELALKSVPSILVLRTSSKKDMEEALRAAISEKSGLSIELLKDGNVSDRILQQFDNSYVSDKYPASCIVYNENTITKIDIPEAISIKRFDEIIGELLELTWFDSCIGKDYKVKLLLEFTEKKVLQGRLTLYQFFKNKIKKDDLSKLERKNLNEKDIKEYFRALLLKELSMSSPLAEIAKETIFCVAMEKLRGMEEMGKLKELLQEAFDLCLSPDQFDKGENNNNETFE